MKNDTIRQILQNSCIFSFSFYLWCADVLHDAAILASLAQGTGDSVLNRCFQTSDE